MNTRFPTQKPRLVLRAFSAGFVLASVISVLVHSLVSGSGSFLPHNQTASLDYFLAPQGFSEVENTRLLLEALADQSLSELRQRNLTLNLRTSGKARGPADSIALQQLIEDVRDAIAAFAGTRQEHVFQSDLLVIFKRERMHDAWLDAYLHLLYRQPTHSIIGRFIHDAVQIGSEAGRQSEVVSACTHVVGIPLQFEGKNDVASALARATGTHLARGALQ